VDLHIHFAIYINLSSSVHELLKFGSNKPIYSDRNHERHHTCLSFRAEASNNFRRFSYRCDTNDFLTLPVTLILEAAVPIWFPAPSLNIRLSMNLLQREGEGWGGRRGSTSAVVSIMTKFAYGARGENWKGGKIRSTNGWFGYM